MFTALFALARTVGWIAQWKEMLEDPHQKIGRPRQIYTGATRARLHADREAVTVRRLRRLRLRTKSQNARAPHAAHGGFVALTQHASIASFKVGDLRGGALA